MNKKVLIGVLLCLPLMFFGCTKTKEKEMVCKKDLNYQDSNITWINEVSVKYDNNDEIVNTTVKEFITVDPSITDERREAFKTGIEKECSSEMGTKFDSCTLDSSTDRFVITFETNKLEVLDSAISKSDEQNIDTDSKINGVKTYLEKKGYVCEEVK